MYFRFEQLWKSIFDISVFIEFDVLKYKLQTCIIIVLLIFY